jgi:hypothetical protein
MWLLLIFPLTLSPLDPNGLSVNRLDEPDRLVLVGCQKGGGTGLSRPTVHNLIRYHRLISIDRDMFDPDLLLPTPTMLIQALDQHCQRPRSLVRERQKLRTCLLSR